MPNYEPFETVYYRQTDQLFRKWLIGLKEAYNASYREPFKIDEKIAKNAFDEGMSPHQCISELHYD